MSKKRQLETDDVKEEGKMEKEKETSSALDWLEIGMKVFAKTAINIKDYQIASIVEGIC